MGQSIGDLFVKLGFDVDDSKLKSFDESIKGVFNTVLGLAGITASAAGFVAIAKGASDTALTIDNLTQKFGISTKAIQDFASALSVANPAISRDQGIGALGHFADYLNSAATKGTGASALNQLGVQFSTQDLQHPERIISQLLTTVPQLLAAHPNMRGRYAELLDQLFGNVNAINTFAGGKNKYDQDAEAGRVAKEDMDLLVKARDQLSGLINEWNKFATHVAASLAGAFIELNYNIENPAPQDKEHPYLSAIGRFTDWLGKKDPFNAAGGFGFYAGGKMLGNALIDTAKIGDRASQARAYLESQGWTPAQAAGMVDRLMKESNVDPNAVNPTSGARGIAQWLGSRVGDFKSHEGVNLAGSSLEQQLDFMNYELTKGLERKAGEKLRETHSRREAELATRNFYERPDPPAVTLHVTQHIASNDPDQAGKASAQALQDQITAALLNRIGVNP